MAKRSWSFSAWLCPSMNHACQKKAKTHKEKGTNNIKIYKTDKTTKGTKSRFRKDTTTTKTQRHKDTETPTKGVPRAPNNQLISFTCSFLSAAGVCVLVPFSPVPKKKTRKTKSTAHHTQNKTPKVKNKSEHTASQPLRYGAKIHTYCTRYDFTYILYCCIYV